MQSCIILIVLLMAFPALAQNGLRGEYFDNELLQGSPVIRTDPNVNFDWGEGIPITGIPSEGFSVRWTGEILPRYSDTYTFYLTSDDGSRLWVDGKRIANQWAPQLKTTVSGQIALQAGRRYSIQCEFFDRTVSAFVSLEWSSRTQFREIV